MRNRGLFALAAIAAATASVPASAATDINFTLGANDADFIAVRPSTVTDRQYVGSGEIIFLTSLTNGVYSLADLASFNLKLELRIRPTGAPAGFYATADYSFGLTDLSAFQITYAGGVPVSASWTLNPVAFYKATGIAPAPASVDFVSGNDGGVYFYGWPNGGKMLIAKSDSIDATFGETHTSIPEPATWVMLIAGFGGAGLALRRRRAVARISFA